MDEYYPESEANIVHIGNADFYYSNRGIERHGELYEYRNEYYDIRALNNADLVLDYEGDVRRIDDVFYWESDGSYRDEPENEDDSEEYLRGYHDGRYKTLSFTKSPKFLIGFEIEKEDETVKESIYIDEFESNCPLWRKERDGSLNSDSGFELISPAFELKPKLIKEHITTNETLISHINADKGHSCGGHINLSEVGKTGLEFFESIKGFTPLIHALYHKRINVNYSKGKSNADLISENAKYQSIKIHSDRVEFRIISAVPNVETLLWRCELMNLITKNQTSDTKQAFFLIHTVLRSHLAKMYKKDRMNELIDRVVKFTLEFEGIKLEKQTI
jgi:hypothetical protein